MSQTATSLRQLAPAIIFWSVLMLLPVGRASALPVLVMLVGGLVIAIRQRAQLFGDPVLRLFVLLFACFWLPVAASAVDAVNADKAWNTTLAMLRFVPVGWFALWTLRDRQRRTWLSRWSCWLLIFWAGDALVQAVFGSNLFGMPHPPDRLNGIFDDNMKLGQVMAVMSPLALEHARRYWDAWRFCLLYSLLLTVVLLSGTRAAWVMYAVVTLCYAALYARSHGRRFWRAALAMGVSGLLILTAAYQLSPTFEQRLDRSLLLLEGDAASVDLALSTRLPIWQTAVEMARHHWLNGVGVRSFRYAYEEFADSDDPWLELMAERGAYHAHQILLEAATETGLLGVIGWIVMAILLGGFWLRSSAAQRRDGRAFAIALLATVFPLNTHLAFYSTYWSLVFWWLLIGFLALTQNVASGDDASRA